MSRAPDGPRVAVVTNVLAHYRVPCFARLAALLPGRVSFYLLTDKMSHRSYVLAGAENGSLPIVTLRGRWRWRRPPYDDVHWNDPGPVLRGNYDVVILGGWAEPTYLWLWLRHQLFGRRTRLLFWVESTAADFARRSSREAFKRLLVGRSAGCLVPGRRAGDYCRQLGVPEDGVFTAPNATDGAFFRRRAERYQPQRRQLRAELGLTEGSIRLLFVGRLVESMKGVATLLEAVAEVEARGFDVRLCLAGDGPDRSRYEALVQELGCRGVRFLGTLDHEQLCRHYAAADALVLPSRSEPWGFVLNEAMEFGLPLVVSDAVGAAPDLVEPGVNGLVVPTGDAPALADALTRLAGDAELRQAMGHASRSRIQSFTPDHWARGVVRAADAVTAGP